jgi:hypothetical protein
MTVERHWAGRLKFSPNYSNIKIDVNSEKATHIFVLLKGMYFDDYRAFPTAKLDSRLLWEYNLEKVDYTSMRNVIVQRVIERGWPQDWYFILNQYGIDGVKSAIKELQYLNDKDMNFVSHQFDIPLTAMKCYIKKQSVTSHWTS